MKLLLVTGLLTYLSGWAYAPFPAGHHYNWANPYIDPIFSQLNDDTKKEVYNTWLVYEPYKQTFAEYKNKVDRRKQADATAWLEGKQLLKAKFKEIKDAYSGDYLEPAYADVTKHDPETGKVKTEARYQHRSAIQWEKFQTAFQHAIYLRLAEKRALYDTVLQKARLRGRKSKAAKKNLKATVLQTKDEFEDKYLGKLEKFREKLYEVWLKGEEVKRKVKSTFQETQIPPFGY